MVGKDNNVQTINVSISYDPFTQKFYQELETHLASLRNVLSSIDQKKYHEVAQHSVSGGFLGLSLNRNDDTDKSTRIREIRETFVDFLRSFVDLLDSLIGINEVLASPPKLNKKITDLKQLEQFMDACITKSIHKIAKDTSLNNPNKLDLLPKLSEPYDAAIRGYFDIRASIEHNKSIAKKEIDFSLQRQGIFTDNGTEIKSTPLVLKEASTISLQVKWDTVHIAQNNEIIISELDLEHLFMTFRLCIVPELITKLITNTTGVKNK